VYFHSLYGLTVASDRHLPAPPARHDHVDLRIAETFERLALNDSSYVDGFSYNSTPDAIHVSWSDLFDFTVSTDGSHITIHAAQSWHSEPVYTYLLGQVVSVALLQKQIESLHASAVACDGAAVALLGTCGAGKSTLIAAMIAAGATLVTDDLLVLARNGDAYVAVSGARRFKLAPETADKLGILYESIPMDDGSGKHVYDVPAESFAFGQTPLHAVIVLRPFAETTAMRRMDSGNAVREVIAATFNPLQNDRERLSRLLMQAHSLASAVPFYELWVPRDLRSVPRVIELIAQK
jgi:hypothetical protein